MTVTALLHTVCLETIGDLESLGQTVVGTGQENWVNRVSLKAYAFLIRRAELEVALTCNGEHTGNWVWREH